MSTRPPACRYTGAPTPPDGPPAGARGPPRRLVGLGRVASREAGVTPGEGPGGLAARVDAGRAVAEEAPEVVEDGAAPRTTTRSARPSETGTPVVGGKGPTTRNPSRIQVVCYRRPQDTSAHV